MLLTWKKLGTKFKPPLTPSAVLFVSEKLVPKLAFNVKSPKDLFALAIMSL
ncbi:hypothetical protein D3C87_1729200 [compost metagenome]